MSLQPKDVVGQLTTLASLPQVCFRLNDLMDDPRCSTNDFATVLSSDPGLAARVLKVANSSFYGYRATIDSLPRAVMVIGMHGLRDIVWATSCVSTFASLPPRLVDMGSFWRHSVYTALVARLLGAKCRVQNKERLFLAGLLHDLGRLALYHVMPEEMAAVIGSATVVNEPAFLRERRILGFDHAAVGAELLAEWGLPKSIVEAVGFHHEPWLATEGRKDASILHLATYMADCAGYHGTKETAVMAVDPSAWSVAGLTDKLIEPMIDLANEQFVDAAGIYLGPYGLAQAA